MVEKTVNNLLPIMKRLTVTERAVLARIISQREQWADYHVGMLPFMNRTEVLLWLREWNHRFGSRLTKRLYDKIKEDKPAGFCLTLNDTKVWRRFRRPELGVQIPGLPTYFQPRERRPFEANLKGVHVKRLSGSTDPKMKYVWNYLTDEEPVVDIKNHTVSIKRVATNRWLVSCTESIRSYVEHWLTENLA